MRDVAVLLPALDEAGNVSAVVGGFRRQGARVVVVDNGSRDETAALARSAGAELAREPRRGYGMACLAGVRHLRESSPPRVVAFADCDGTIDPEDLPRLVAPLVAGRADLALGRRALVEQGALSSTTRWGNAIACRSLRLLYGARVRDVPPFRALSWSLLSSLGLRERTYGLPLETLALAARRRARIVEVDVAYRRRASGESKVTGRWWSATKCFVNVSTVAVRARFRRLPA